MTAPNYDDILNALAEAAQEQEMVMRTEQRMKNARLLREAMDIVRERRDQGESERPPQEMDLG